MTEDVQPQLAADNTNGPAQIDRPSQYPTATRIENGIAYDVSGKPLGPVNDGQPTQAKDDDFFLKIGGKPVPSQEVKDDDFFAKLGGKEVPGVAQVPTGPATSIGPRGPLAIHVSGGKDIFGREIEASPAAARAQWANWFEDMIGDVRNGTDATWVGWLLRKAGAKGSHYGVSPAVGDFMTGPLIGPAEIGHAAAIAQEHPVSAANEFVSGVGHTLGPLAVTQPEALPFMAMAGSTSEGVSFAAKHMGADDETAELIGNVAGLAVAVKPLTRFPRSLAAKPTFLQRVWRWIVSLERKFIDALKPK